MTHASLATTDAPARKPRHDAFDGERRRAFLEALKRCACLRQAAREARVSHQTVYNHQNADPGFARQCELALEMAGTDVELHAWERGVTGIREPVFNRKGELVGYRIKRSDAVLRLLLQGAKPDKYGRNPGFTRPRLLKIERQRLEEEVRAEWNATRRPSMETIERELEKAIGRQAGRAEAKRLAAGWIKSPDGHMIPPGWVRAEGWAALADPAAEIDPDLDTGVAADFDAGSDPWGERSGVSV